MNKALQIPAGWKEKRLKDVGKCLTGLTYTPKDVTDDSGLLVLRSSNVQGGKLVFDDNVYVKRDVNVKNYTQSGDILVCVRNGSRNLIGKNAIVTNDGEGLAHGAFMMLFRSKQNQYLYQLFSSDMYNKQVYRNLGATINSINSSDFYKFRFPFPPLPEQKAIAALLSTWDKAIEKTERLIQAKEKRFKWLLRELISEPRKTQKDAKWIKVKIGSFLTESRNPDRENDPKKRLSVRLHLKGVEVRDYRGTESDGATVYFVRKAGQFIYGKQNVFRGSVGIVPLELDGYSSTQDIPAFDVASNVDKNWLLFLFSYPNFYKRLELYASGSGSKRLHPKELFKMKVALPSFEEQQEISETLSSAQHEVDLLKQLADKYKTQKRGLMQKMLAGEWRVRGFATSEEV